MLLAGSLLGPKERAGYQIGKGSRVKWSEVEWSRCRLYGSFASQLQFIDFPSSTSSRNTKERAINFHLFCRQRGRRSRVQGSTKEAAQATVMATVTATGATTLAGCSGKHIAHSQTFGTLPRSRVTRHGISSGFWLKSGCLFMLTLSPFLSLSLSLFVAQLLFTHPLFVQKLGRLLLECRLFCALAPDDGDGHGWWWAVYQSLSETETKLLPLFQLLCM